MTADGVPASPQQSGVAYTVRLSAIWRVAPDRTATARVVQELSLPAMRRIVDTARDVTGVRYAALGVIDADGLLEQFRSRRRKPCER